MRKYATPVDALPVEKEYAFEVRVFISASLSPPVEKGGYRWPPPISALVKG